VDGGAGYDAPVLLGNTATFNDEVLIEANFDVSVSVYASAGADFESTYASYTETAEGRASADPTFAIDEPGRSAYTIEGVPAGPAATATPEPSTGPMMLIGFSGLGYAGYRRRCAPPHAQSEDSRVQFNFRNDGFALEPTGEHSAAQTSAMPVRLPGPLLVRSLAQGTR
jgi:hypothetical protein